MKRVLLADHLKSRAAALCQLLRDTWRLEVVHLHDADGARKFLKDVESSREARVDIVMVAFGFSNEDHAWWFRRLSAAHPRIGVLISTRPVPIPTNAPVTHVVVIPAHPPYDKLQVELARFLDTPARIQIDEDDHLLKAQVRWIDSSGDLEKGKAILTHLVDQLLPQSVATFNLSRLQQGFSGARVFLAEYKDPETQRRVKKVIKLTPNLSYQSWKCHNELENYRLIQTGLLHNPVFNMIPKISGIMPDDGSFRPAQFEDWLAIAYDFFGDNQSSVSDLARAYLNPREVMHDLRNANPALCPRFREQELAGRLLRDLLQRVEAWWKPNKSIQDRVLWSGDEAPDDRPLELPFRFRRWERSRILEALYSLDGYGKSILGNSWDESWKLTLQCLLGERDLRRKLPAVFRRHPVLITPVHGDLNANNVLLSLNPMCPLLIDFACFLREGLAMQDFARLELAIKLELSGREQAARSKAKDLDYRMFRKLVTAENDLTNSSTDLNAGNMDTAKMVAQVHSQDPVLRAYRLCRWLRMEARTLHDNFVGEDKTGGDAPTFHFSYNVALLYHTVRAVGYDTLPHIKRIFAVHSAAMIIKSLT